MPSITACGSPSMMARSMNAPGSPSSALQIRYFLSPGARRQSSHFSPVGKPAPPRPLSPEALISSITCSGVIGGNGAPRALIAADRAVGIDVFRVDRPAGSEHHFVLLGMELLVLRPGASHSFTGTPPMMCSSTIRLTMFGLTNW